MPSASPNSSIAGNCMLTNYKCRLKLHPAVEGMLIAIVGGKDFGIRRDSAGRKAKSIEPQRRGDIEAFAAVRGRLRPGVKRATRSVNPRTSDFVIFSVSQRLCGEAFNRSDLRSALCKIVSVAHWREEFSKQNPRPRGKKYGHRNHRYGSAHH